MSDRETKHNDNQFETNTIYDNDSESDISNDTIGHLDELELTRINTYRLQQKTTVGSVRGLTPREQWLAMGAGKEHPPLLPDSEAYVVEFDGADDPLHPYNWPSLKRYA
jgi:DHA1 family multidrug resistance protein-like MFS transporter